METLPFTEVDAIRQGFAQGREIAAARFREAFASTTGIPPEERWRAHLEIQAVAMLEIMRGVSLPAEYALRYLIQERPQRLIFPYVAARGATLQPAFSAELRPERALYPFFRIERTLAAVFEYWMFTSELMATSAWAMTKVIATPAEYDAAIAAMKDPQVLKPLFVSILPRGEFRTDQSVMFEVTVYSRAGSERLERRELLLDPLQQIHFHGRELLVEGKGGVGSA